MKASIERVDALGVALSAEAVWVASDVHGVYDALLAALHEAGLIDDQDAWSAPAGTTLVVLGDMIDRGRNSAAVVSLLLGLARTAPDREGAVVLLRGNHEAMMTEALLAGDERMYSTWLQYGGRNTLASLGIDPDSRAVRRGPTALHHAVRAAAPGLLGTLLALPEWLRWNDVLFTHGGPLPGVPPSQWRPNGAHLWHRQRWDATDWNDVAWDVYRDVGIERFVMGHTPMDGVKTFLDGRLLAVDTNACGVWDTRHGRVSSELSLVRLPDVGSMRAARCVVVDTSNSPDRFQTRAARDAA